MNGREIFAIWRPSFGSNDLSFDYLTDANGIELMTRRVFEKDSGAFSSSFYPITSLISMSDADKENAFTVWNDRPQAGSVHYDGGMKLLIDRRVSSIDLGGIPDPMFLHFDDPLILDFRVKLHKYDNL